MKSKLLKDHKTKEDKEKYKKYLLEHKGIFVLLSDIVKDELNSLNKESISKPQYEDHSWVYRQADLNGCMRTYEKLLNLLNIEE